LVVVDTPKLSINNKNGEQINVTAELGTVDKNSHIMNFHGAVRAQGDRQFGLLTTEWLQFDPKEGILYTDQQFYLRNKMSELKGTGLTIFHKRKQMQVLQKVEMKFIGGAPTLTGEWGS
jgi:LPS export ABC transporter protein LptC